MTSHHSAFKLRSLMAFSRRDAGCSGSAAQMEGGTREAVEAAILSRVTHIKAEAEITL